MLAWKAALALVPTGDPPSQSSGTLMSLRAMPPACAGTAKGRRYPRSVGEITPPLERFVPAAQHPALKRYLRNILEKHCSVQLHNLRWSYHAVRPEGAPQMRNHYYKYLLGILLLIACVLLVTLAVLSNNNPGNGKDGTASTHAPSNTSTYWDKDRMESASPAPMPK